MTKTYDNNNKGSLWKNKVCYRGRFTIENAEYKAELWKLADGNALLVLGEDISKAVHLLFADDGGKSILSVALKDSDGQKYAYLNVYVNQYKEPGDKKPELNLVYKPVNAAPKQEDDAACCVAF